jgi:outer membrane protein TolC
MRLVLAAMALAAFCFHAGAQSQLPRTSATLAEATGQANSLSLDAISLTQALTLQSLEVAYAKESASIAKALAQAEAALYEPVLFATAKRYGTTRQRAADEKYYFLSSEPVLLENGRSAEAGVKQRLPTGGDLSLSVRSTQRENNILTKSTPPVEIEVNSMLAFSYKQPLWRGYGTSVTETDKRVAQREADVAQWQFRQQLLKVVSEGLSTYWQASAANEIATLRAELLGNTEALLSSIRERVQAGKLAPRAVSEIERLHLSRQAEHHRARQTADDLSIKLLSALNLPQTELARLKLSFLPPASPRQTKERDTEALLAQWAPYQVARLRKEQGDIRLNYALNQSRPAIDFTMSYSPTGLADRNGSWDVMRHGRYSEWTVGLNIEMGAFGNQKPSLQAQAQSQRVNQSEMEIEAVRTAFVNDLGNKQAGSQRSEQEVMALAQEIRLRQQYRDEEKERFEIGTGLLSQWTQAELDLAESRIRWIEAFSRQQVARVSLYLSEGTLLSVHGVESPPPTALP